MNYFKLSSTSLLFLLMAGLGACSKSDSGTKFDPAKVESYKEVQDLSGTLVRWTSQKKLEFSKPEDQKVIESFNTVGCEKGNGSTAIPDPNLRPGDEILQQFSSNTQHMHLSTISKKILREIGADSMSYILRYLSVSVTEAGGEILNGNPEELRTCQAKKTDNQSAIQCKNSQSQENQSQMYNEKGRDFISKMPKLDSFKCFLKQEDSKQESSALLSSEYEVGNYKLASGAEIRGLLHQYVRQGQVVCNDQVLGKGTQTTILLRSNEVMPVGDFYYCGGVSLIFSNSIKLDKKTIESFRSEILNGTLRK